VDPDSRGARSGLRVAVTDHLGRPLRAPGLAAWLVRVAPASARGEVAIALVSNRRIRALNARFRRVDKATDVLSFPESAPRVPRPASRASRPSSRAPRPSSRAPRPLGDIVISADTARRQAGEAGHSYATELKVLALHGLLHLLGYDHHARSDGGRMARLERRLRVKGGLPAGLIERARAAGRTT
jgi:probable rRNA maturation factor